MAQRNRKTFITYEVFIIEIWWSILRFGSEPQTSFQNKTVSKSDLVISINRGGELVKHIPRPRAKDDAVRNTKKGKAYLVDGFVPQKIYCIYHKNYPLSCRTHVKFQPGNEETDTGDQDNMD